MAFEMAAKWAERKALQMASWRDCLKVTLKEVQTV